MAILLLVVLAGGHAAAHDVRLPHAGGQYDSQLGGAYEPPRGTMIVSRDRSEAPAPGLYNICCVNAFQTQPHETAWWVANHPDLLLRQGAALFEDPNWPGEVLFDTGSADKRASLAAIVGEWIAQCAADGYDAIEADNLDTYSRSDGALSVDDNLAYARLLIDQAHGLGLAFAQKNSGDLGTLGKAAGFDFAIVESCQAYDECDRYMDVYGRSVLAIEYTDTEAANFEMSCAARGRQISVIRRDRNLTMPGEPSYFYQTC
ncbi:endo alpha-1,4 polygalactosaminidase [Devosia oryziradicis]|uniref:Endo alpha-1,4 polygalactosaminidase n=1 Tax=Devosia oryziradicis TaxID=2801335 RepID=A0ABX7BXB0_9HYPH|nr:endo alpha-1,4 polygalactosaminidase [Devosia oryziradicis]QQR35065.1 endo alpha-1,4 polygalactosaminidase [Devosia oryziradicis]